MHEDFQRFQQNVLPDLNLSAEKKRLYSFHLLSERRGIIDFTLNIDPISII